MLLTQFYVAEQKRMRIAPGPNPRRDEMLRLRGEGETYAAIGRRFGISLQRVTEIIIGKRPRPKRPPPENWPLSVQELAYYLKVHVSSIGIWEKLGLLKSSSLGTRGRKRYLQEDVEAFLKSHPDSSHAPRRPAP